ncbi:MAG: cbb3-type cytochrome c oxidase subunit II [Leptospirillia bacterium]
MYATFCTLRLLLAAGVILLSGGPAALAGSFPAIPHTGAQVAAASAKAITPVLKVVPDDANRRIAEDLSGPGSRVFYRGWNYMRVPGESSRHVALTGTALRASPELSREDQTLVDELAALLESLAGRELPPEERYFHWAAVGQRYAVIVGIGDVVWIDMVEGGTPQVHVLARTGTVWQRLLSTNLKAFVRIEPPKTVISEVLQPFLARSHHFRHPNPPFRLFDGSGNPTVIVRRGKEVANPIAVGMQIYDREKCWACHRIAGAGGLLGPDLTHIGRRMPSVAWHTQHDKDPRSVQPRSIMPEYGHLSPEEHEALSRFLLSLK